LRNEKGGIVLGVLAITGIISLGVAMFAFGGKTAEYKKKKVDIGLYGDDKAPLNSDEELKKDKKALLGLIVDGGKVVVGVGDDTALLIIPQELGVFDVKKKNTEEDNKIKNNLKSNGLASDPLTVDISKIIKAKIENNSTPGTSSEKIDAMMIKIMEDIEEEEKLFDNMERDSNDDVKEIDAIIDMVSHIEEILKTNNKLADQKIIDIKNSLNRAESEKKYLEGIVKAYEDAEKEGGILGNTQGIIAIKARLEEAEKIISGLKEELQQYEDEAVEVTDEEDIEDQDIEDVSTDGGTQDDSTDEDMQDAVNDEIILNGTMSFPGESSQKMTMIVNPGTGSVTAVLHIKIDEDGIKLEFDVPFFGSIDPETRVINAVSSGGDEDIKLTGILSTDGNRASGTGDDGMVWSVSR